MKNRPKTDENDGFIPFHVRRVLTRLMWEKLDGIGRKCNTAGAPQGYTHGERKKNAIFCDARDHQNFFDFDQAEMVLNSNEYMKHRVVESALISGATNVNLSLCCFAKRTL